VHVNAVHAKEIEQLHQQLNAAEVKVKQVKQEAEQRIFELQRQQIITSDRQMADLQECLEVERRQSSGLSWECDYLRREIEAARSCLKGESNLIREHDEYIQSHKEEQEVNANLIRSLRKKDEESVRKADEEAKDMQRLVKDMEELQREFTQLKDEFAPLKSFSLSQTAESRSNASSTPSQSPSTSYAEQRLANMRKTYITVKRRYDRLHAVAMNISTTTRSWDYGSFGEHGQYLRQLKTALDDNGQEEQAVGLNSPVAKVE
jgi:chromosome segregation ATPase